MKELPSFILKIRWKRRGETEKKEILIKRDGYLYQEWNEELKDVNSIIHYGAPHSLDDYFQE